MARRKYKRLTKSLKTPNLPELQVGHHTARDIKGLFFVAFGIIILLALIGGAGLFGDYFNKSFGILLGNGVWFVPFACFLIALFYFFLPSFLPTYTRIVGITIVVLSFLGLMHITVPIDIALEKAQNFEGGGIIGFTLGIILKKLIGETGGIVVLVIGVIIGVFITFNLSMRKIGSIVSWFFKVPVEEKTVPITPVKEEPAEKVKKKKEVEKAKKEGFTKQKIQQKELEMDMGPKMIGDYKLPDLTLLEDPKTTDADPGEIDKNKLAIQNTLANFGIMIQIEDIEHHVGPTVTQYAFKPPEGVKISRITALQNDLALALAAESLRMEAPIPGKSAVGLELPNQKRSDVYLKEMIASPEFLGLKGNLTVCIGKNVSGKPIVADLTRMPRLLVAGATGSGKSVGINAILLSLLYHKSPEDLKLILVDPKRVELTNYNGIPHLLTPVITEPETTVTVLRWTVAEMNSRYKTFEAAREKNIEAFNHAFPDRKIPYIVVVVDELADLMMVASKEVEASICRIAQLARAVGIHLIVATQRPSVDVITGLIKANIPTRIAYTVSSGTDSRTILDTIGAEKLLGLGDMLYLDGKSPKPVRLQGVYVSSKEIKRVINDIRLRNEAEYHMDIVEEKREIPQGIPGAGTMGVLDDGDISDQLEKEAIDVLLETKKASASLLQRRLRIGYARAARLLDILEEKGFIGEAHGAKPREIYISRNPYKE